MWGQSAQKISVSTKRVKRVQKAQQGLPSKNLAFMGYQQKAVFLHGSYVSIPSPTFDLPDLNCWAKFGGLLILATVGWNKPCWSFNVFRFQVFWYPIPLKIWAESAQKNSLGINTVKGAQTAQQGLPTNSCLLTRFKKRFICLHSFPKLPVNLEWELFMLSMTPTLPRYNGDSSMKETVVWSVVLAHWPGVWFSVVNGRNKCVSGRMFGCFDIFWPG